MHFGDDFDRFGARSGRTFHPMSLVGFRAVFFYEKIFDCKAPFQCVKLANSLTKPGVRNQIEYQQGLTLLTCHLLLGSKYFVSNAGYLMAILPDCGPFHAYAKYIGICLYQ